ncbi:hypothetical protein CR513_45375, partial [Mucuna pruriens]
MAMDECLAIVIRKPKVDMDCKVDLSLIALPNHLFPVFQFEIESVQLYYIYLHLAETKSNKSLLRPYRPSLCQERLSTLHLRVPVLLQFSHKITIERTMSLRQIRTRKKSRNGLEGISRASLEERLQQLQREEDWPTFIDVYGLLIYNIVLFPQIEDYVDLAAIDAFLGKRD